MLLHRCPRYCLDPTAYTRERPPPFSSGALRSLDMASEVEFAELIQLGHDM